MNAGTKLAVHVVEVNGYDWVGHNEKKGGDGQDQGLWGKNSRWSMKRRGFFDTKNFSLKAN